MNEQAARRIVGLANGKNWREGMTTQPRVTLRRFCNGAVENESAPRRDHACVDGTLREQLRVGDGVGLTDLSAGIQIACVKERTTHA